MEWEEQGEQDAEAVQRRPDNISYPVLKCIVLSYNDAHTGCCEMAHYILSSAPLPRVPKQLIRGWCMLLQSLPLSYAPECVCVYVYVCVCNHNQHCSAGAERL